MTNCTGSTVSAFLNNEFKNHYLQITITYTRGQWIIMPGKLHCITLPGQQILIIIAYCCALQSVNSPDIWIRFHNNPIHYLAPREKWQPFYLYDIKTQPRDSVHEHLLWNCCEIAVGWMPRNILGDRSTLAQVIAFVVRQQAISWTNNGVDFCRYKAPLHLNEITHLEVTR